MKKFLFKSVTARFVFVLAIGICFISSCQSLPVNSQTTRNMKEKFKNLEDFKWEKRIILIKEENDTGLQALTKATKEINERHIVWFRLKDDNVKTNYRGSLPENLAQMLNEKYFKKFDSNAFLIGKDGGIKSKNKKFDLKNYFGQIDSMPMRQQEMQEN